jgi:hypothetical protein
MIASGKVNEIPSGTWRIRPLILIDCKMDFSVESGRQPEIEQKMLKIVKNQSTTTNIEALRNLLTDDLEAVDKHIHTCLQSDVALINQLSHYIVNSGGKRLRPMLLLLSANASRYTGNQHINLAAVIEFIHTATLLHDDVVDASQLRRGNMTANAVWGNEASVLVGDFLYSRAFEMMVSTPKHRNRVTWTLSVARPPACSKRPRESARYWESRTNR